MRMLIVTLLLLLLISGCTTQESRQRYMEEQRLKLSATYKIGISRDELSAQLNTKPYATAIRPSGGWTASDNLLMAKFARSIETQHSVVIQRCDIYSVPRETSLSSVPMALGFYFDYVAFDQNDKLIDFYRRFMD